MDIDKKSITKFCNFITKISAIYNDFFILNTGYILSLNIEKPYVFFISDEYMEIFNKIFGEFKILHILDSKTLKKVLSEMEDEIPDISSYISREISSSNKMALMIMIQDRLSEIQKCTWNKFILSNDNDENTKLISSIFDNNDYINFTPKDNLESPDIILTKNILPMVTAKNYTNLYYSSFKKSDSLYVIVFNFKYPPYDLYMVHYYISSDD